MDASREEAGGWIEAARLLKEVAYVSFIYPCPDQKILSLG